MSDLVTLDDIRTAAARISGPGDHAGHVGHVVRTPLIPAPWSDPERPLWLKPESLQRIGAFKIRGAMNALAALDDETRHRGIVTSSSGNHGQAVAYAAALHGVEATVVMPEGSSPRKTGLVRDLGATVVMVPPSEREVRPRELAEEHGYAIVPPYDHPDVIAGQGTVGLEIVEDLPPSDGPVTVLVQVGGGGLISGIATAVKSLAPHVTVIGVEPELAADLAESRRRGELVAWTPERTFRTIADGVRTTSVGRLPWRHIQEYVDDVLTVPEDAIREAMRRLAVGSRLVAEPSGAVSTAAYLTHGASLGNGPVVAIVSGGNVDPVLLAEILTT